jgi:1-acyl-sn-glycerol-3-phosphate acyltransferase
VSRVPTLPPAVPRRGNALLRALGTLGLWLLRWRVEGGFPDVPKMVIIVAPHTSNWDFFVGLFAALALDIDARWFGKHTIFRGPLAPILRSLGGIPVDRGTSQHVVAQWVAAFANRERMVVGMAPEGTRGKVDTWRTGFWYLASRANVPVVPAALDYGARVATIAPAYWPTGDLESDLVRLKACFAHATPRHPELF